MRAFFHREESTLPASISPPFPICPSAAGSARLQNLPVHLAVPSPCLGQWADHTSVEHTSFPRAENHPYVGKLVRREAKTHPFLSEPFASFRQSQPYEVMASFGFPETHPFAGKGVFRETANTSLRGKGQFSETRRTPFRREGSLFGSPREAISWG